MENCNNEALEPIRTSSEDLTVEDWISSLRNARYRDEADKAERIDALAHKNSENLNQTPI